MGIELRLPNISGNDKEQLVQIRSYLYQIIPQLQWALNNVSATEVSSGTIDQIARRISSASVSGVPSTSVSAEVTFDKLKPLIIKSADIVEAYYEEINKRLESLYVAESDFGTFMEKTTQDIEETSSYVDQKFSDIQVIITDEVDGLKVSYQEVDGKIVQINDSVSLVGQKAAELDDSVAKAEQSIIDTNAKVDETSGAVENLKADINDTSEKVDILDGLIKEAQEKLNLVNAMVLASKAHIKTGEIDRRVDSEGNEFPVIGIEMGQIDTANGDVVSQRYARFTSGKLSFYDQSGTEVAYISNNKLFIEKAEILRENKFGGFVDTIMAGGDVVTKWVGGEG